MRHISSLLIALSVCPLPLAAMDHGTVRTNQWGVELQIGNAHVELAPATAGALRLSVGYNGAPAPAPSCFLAPATEAKRVAWHPVGEGGWVGIQTAAGAVLVDPKTGRWTLKNAAGERVIVPGDEDRFQLATNASEPLVEISYSEPARQPFGFYGCGNGSATLLQDQAATRVANGIAVMPGFWSAAGYAVLAVSGNDNLPASWRASANRRTVTWSFPGTTADLYLMPAAGLRDAAGAGAGLTGRAPVPPRWTFGYLQSRWGWKDQAYIEDTLKQFRTRKIPVDAFIVDFEWYTAKPDYEVPAEGVPGFSDFNWNPNLFPNPAGQIQAYRQEGVRFVGIRKPRLGNSATLTMIRSHGWDQRGKGTTQNFQFQSRDVHFGNPDFRAWYAGQTTNLLAQGVDGWWNDEGEGAYTSYYYWNLAEAEALALVHPSHRLWTLNRAFSPGLQRLGAAAWTGDIDSSWPVLKSTPTSLLNWSLAGMTYNACDIGGYDGDGPSPELLSRWMEAGVFFPVMRSHSTLIRTPRFPWLFGPDAEKAIRKAIELRYRLIPYYYSLAHEAFATGLPIMRPLLMEFPNDPAAANLSDQWLMGASLMAAPVLQPGGKRSVYLPAGTWYVFDTNQTVQGGQTLERAAALDEIPLYVKAGTILPLAPVVQSTRQLPGGPLELQIYPGKDATFSLVEDDGETTAYQHGQLRRTTFKWDDAAGRLRWKREGPYAGQEVFREMRVVVFGHQGRIESRCALNASGSLALKRK